MLRAYLQTTLKSTKQDKKKENVQKQASKKPQKGVDFTDFFKKDGQDGGGKQKTQKQRTRE